MRLIKKHSIKDVEKAAQKTVKKHSVEGINKEFDAVLPFLAEKKIVPDVTLVRPEDAKAAREILDAKFKPGNTFYEDLEEKEKFLKGEYGTIGPVNIEKVKKMMAKNERWQLSDGITQSFIAQWLSCKESARLAYTEGWASQQTSNALTFGTLTHNCLESVYKHIQAGKKIEDPKYIENTINFFLQEYKEKASKERLWTPEDAQAHQLNTGYLHTLLPVYFKKYLAVDSNLKFLAVEEEFKNIWTGNIPLRGKIDIVYETNGEVWIMDHKTASRFDEGKEARLSFDLQGLFYILNWWLKTGKLASGFKQNIVMKPQLRQGKKESLKEFIDRMKQDVEAAETTNDSYFKRIQMKITKEEFDYWFNKEFKPIMDEVCGWASGLLPNYKNPSACTTQYGSCKFSKVCGLKDFTGLYQRKTSFPELA